MNESVSFVRRRAYRFVLGGGGGRSSSDATKNPSSVLEVQLCLSGGSDISTDDLKKSLHSNSRSQIHKVGELVLRAIQPRALSCSLTERRGIGKEKDQTLECILGRIAYTNEKKKRLELIFALSIIFSSLHDSYTRLHTMVLVLLIPIIGFVAANPFPNTLNNRLIPQASKVQKALSLSMKNRLDTIDNSPDKINEMVENMNNSTLPTLKYTVHPLKVSESETRENETNEKRTIQGRKHKAIFVDYPLISRFLHYLRMPTYEIDYNNNSELTTKNRLSGVSKKYPESDIFYIRLPPIPYMFVPGLGYISQPPTYSSASLKPQIPLVSQLVQLQHVRPVRPQPASQQTVNPFIKLPIDFISNGKPTSIYQWQKKPGKKPTDSPITNLDNLSADFVNNGKPTSIYQWQANLRPVKRPDDSLNSLDIGPYTFNGKLTSMYLLESDDSTSMHQSIQHSNYQNMHD